MAKTRVLIVDDELHQLERLRKALTPVSSSWDMAFAKSGFDALSQCESAPFDVIITDLTMPGMDGIRLLTEVARRTPRVIRLLMTHPQERERTFRSICAAHQFLVKPCAAADITTAVTRTSRLYHHLSAETVQSVVSRIGVLPTLPTLYTRLTRLINDAGSSLTDIAALIEQDVGMSAKVLQLVSSAVFGKQQKVSRIAQAVPLLGLDTLKSLVAWFQIGTQFSNITQAGLDMDELQQHSMLTARYAQLLALHLGFDRFDGDDFFTAGLLHDIGMLILANAFPAQYRDILAFPYDAKRGNTGSEQAVFNGTHAEVGAYLLALWGFRDQVTEAVCFHHRPEQQAARTINSVSVVYLAHVLTREQTPKTPLTFNDRFLKEIGLQQNRIEELRAVCRRGSMAER